MLRRRRLARRQDLEPMKGLLHARLDKGHVPLTLEQLRPGHSPRMAPRTRHVVGLLLLTAALLIYGARSQSSCPGEAYTFALIRFSGRNFLAKLSSGSVLQDCPQRILMHMTHFLALGARPAARRRAALHRAARGATLADPLASANADSGKAIIAKFVFTDPNPGPLASADGAAFQLVMDQLGVEDSPSTCRCSGSPQPRAGGRVHTMARQ